LKENETNSSECTLLSMVPLHIDITAEANGTMSLPLPKKGNKKPFADFLFMVEPVRARRGASIAPTDGLWK
jgi:hypothetical protein